MAVSSKATQLSELRTTSVPTGRGVIARALRRHRGRLAVGLALMCLWQACEAAVPILVGLVIDHAIATPSWGGIAVGLAAVVVLFTVLSLSYRFGARSANTALNRETHQLRVEVARHALNPRGVQTSLMPGEILAIATADADNTASLFRRIALAGSAAVGVLIGAVYLLITDWMVGLVVLVGLPVTLLIAQLVAPVVGRRMERQQQEIAAASGMATDLMTGLRVIKGIGGARIAGRRYHRASRRARDASVRTAGSMALIDGLQQTLVGLLVAAVVIAAGWRVIIGEVTVGELVAMVGLAVFLSEPIGTVVAITAMIAQSLASARRVADFTASPPLLPDGETGTNPDAPAVQLDGLRLDGLPPIDLCVRSGEFVAMAFAETQHAERLAAALAGEPTGHDGGIRIAGAERSELSLVAAQHALVVAPHEADLFTGTIASNVGTRSAPEIDLDAVLQAAAMTELIDLMPDGLDHQVAAGGANLSGGQRQRIALARALAADPPVLVLAEPTTAVDAVTEVAIAGGVKELRKASATIVVTASPAFLAVADRVVYAAADGIRAGRHDELLAVDGYRELVSR